MLLLIDNFDSFTHNLARYFVELGQEVKVLRNNEVRCEDISVIAPNYLVFSPGPGKPDDAGVTLDAISTFAGRVPMLGVCLGHQAIGQAFGAKVTQAQHIKHGKTSVIKHARSPLFQQITDPFIATRYHSLVLEKASIPEEFRVSAWTNNTAPPADTKSEVMAIEHKTLPICGVQFHPESLLTEFGHKLLSNFLNNYRS